MIKSYQELRRLKTFEERYEYLRIAAKVGEETFGFDRYINQSFYLSTEWRHMRDKIIVRDNGCDLGIDGREIYGRIIIHHINPISVEDIELGRACILNPDNLICTSHNTSNAIHFGDASLLPRLPIERRPNDTCPWK